jgi:molecular chaperone GrpE
MDKNKQEQIEDELNKESEVSSSVEATLDQEENEELKQIKAEADDFKNKYLRALADYRNFENRVREERMEIEKMGKLSVIRNLFPILDNLHQAEVFVKDPGLKMVKDNFMKALEEMGVKEVELLGKEFDPHYAEAIDVVE